MRIIYRDNYTPQIGDYHERIIIDGAQEKQWLFDCDGVYTDITGGVEIVNEKGQATNKAVSQKLFTDEINDEANARSEADRAIWQEIEDIEASSDVTDVVGTHADLENYDTSKLKDNDIIKVLEDETQNDQITYYRWDKDTGTFTLIGAVGPYYTQSQADQKFQDKLTAGANISIDANNEISATDTTYTAGTNITIDSDNVISATSYTAGTNVSIDADHVISATDTTYSDFVGTDGVDAGTAGLVPAPATTDAGKFLKADGTWDTVGGGIDPSTTFWGQSVVNGVVDGNITNTKSPSTFGISYTPTGSNRGASVSFNSAGQTTFYSLRKSGGIWSSEVVAYMDTTEFSVKPIISQYTSNPIMPTAAKHYTCKAYVDQVGNTLSPAAPTTATVGVVGQLLTDTSGVALYQCTAVNGGSYTWEKVGAKLYTTTGQNTDGAVTQKLFTDTVGNIETALQILNSGAGVP